MALEAIRGDLTLAELAAKHGVHHMMIAWCADVTYIPMRQDFFMGGVPPMAA